MYVFCRESNAFHAIGLKASYEAAGTWPKDGIPVSEVEYRSLQANLPAGLLIGVLDNGTLGYVLPKPESPEEMAISNKLFLHHQLQKIRPTVMELEDRQSDGVITEAQRTQLQGLKAYRRELLGLDLTQPITKWPAFDAKLLA